MIDKSDLRAAWETVWPFVPPSIGAYFGLRYRTEQTPRERATTWACSVFLSLYLGAAVGEWFGLGPKSTSGATIIIAMLLAEAVGMAVAVARQWIADPAGTFRRWRNAWLGGGEP